MAQGEKGKGKGKSAKTMRSMARGEKGKGKGKMPSARKRVKARDRQKVRNPDGKDRYVEHLSDGPKDRDDSTVWFGKLPGDVVDKQQVLDVFQERFGIVTHIHIQANLKFGFIHFEDASSAAEAMAAESVEICGEPVEVKQATVASAAPPLDGEEKPETEVEAEAGAEDNPMDDEERQQDADPEEQGQDGSLEDEPHLSSEAAEENVQALRTACIHALESSVEGPQMLHKLGSDALITEHKAKLPPGLSFIEFIRTFSQNFEVNDQGNGMFQITLLSPDVDDLDTAVVEALLEKARAGKGRGRGRSDKDDKKTKRADRAARIKDMKEKPVVAGAFSDGFKQRDDRTVWIGRLPQGVRSKHDVADAFQAQMGPVAHIHIMEDLAYGFVHFADARDAAAAMAAGSIDLLGSPLEVKNASGPRQTGSPASQVQRSSSKGLGKNANRLPDRKRGPPPPGPPPGPPQQRPMGQMGRRLQRAASFGRMRPPPQQRAAGRDTAQAAGPPVQVWGGPPRERGGMPRQREQRGSNGSPHPQLGAPRPMHRPVFNSAPPPPPPHAGARPPMRRAPFRGEDPSPMRRPVFDSFAPPHAGPRPPMRRAPFNNAAQLAAPRPPMRRAPFNSAAQPHAGPRPMSRDRFATPTGPAPSSMVPRGGGKGGGKNSSQAAPRAAPRPAPRPSSAPHLENRDGAKRRRM